MFPLFHGMVIKTNFFNDRFVPHFYSLFGEKASDREKGPSGEHWL